MWKSKHRSVLIGASLLVLAGAGRVHAQCLGATPVFAPGTIISADGQYCVTQNILNPGPGPAIEIAACDVHLNLQGFSVANVGGSASPVILVTGAGGCTQLTIRNGTLSGGSHGIRVPAGVLVPDITLEDLRIHNISSGNGIALSDGFRAAIRRNHFGSIGGAAIAWDNLAIPKTGTIADNVIWFTGRGIEVFRSSSLAVLNNRISDVQGTGINITEASSGLIAENTVESADTEGISVLVGRGLKLINNTVVRSGSHGMSLDCMNCLVIHNVSSGSGQAGTGHGLWIQGARNMVERNILNDNTGYGLLFASLPANVACGNTFSGNTARGNLGAGGPACGGVPALSPPNSCNAATPCLALPNTSYGDNLIPGPPVS